MLATVQRERGQALADLDAGLLLSRVKSEGGLLLRGFPCDAAAFESFSRRFCGDFHAVGTRVAMTQPGDGRTSEVFRDNFTLLGHSEGTYRPWPPPPDLCFFACLTAPSAPGGETLVVDGIAFAELLPDELHRRFGANGVTYESHWDADRWRAEFEVRDLIELNELLTGREDVRFNIEGERLDLWYTGPALVARAGGQPAFANGVLAHLPRVAHPAYAGRLAYANPSNRVYFGDGEELTDAVVNTLIDVHDRVAEPHRWQNGDVLILDNRRVMHGRSMTDAPCERALISRFGRLPGDG